ncbi:MAG TPA: IS630 family transposase [Edaphobacter sp.]|uniref:IS630 family transposase n=1 Tax=Edaphobacter sp. TaxID=1934404 RepID=UPI002B643E84|nr:IS630 family transposase [Edaphobacter sp.]HUZ95638.1 IS630 family transposase [Edaphobacter sp.]
MPRTTRSLAISKVQQEQIERWLAALGTPQQVALRCRIILAAGSGETETAIASALQINRKTVRLWRDRFTTQGLQALWEIAPGRGRKPTYSPNRVKAIIDATLQSKPKGSTHWSCRTLAANQGMSKSTVNNIWRSHNLKPHLTKTFKLSRDPRFLEKLTDVVGLYLNPPDKAIVLCVDEKSQIQALNRTQPGLPLKKGRCGTMTHDYKRNGTATLFAALNTLDGTVISMCDDRHRHQEWIRFLRVLDDVTPSDKAIHLIQDNYATHKHPKVRKWLARHPRFHAHFTPTSSSWLNMVERFFRDLTQNGLRRGVFRDVEELITAIGAYIDKHNDRPKPFIWTAKAADILEKVKRASKSLDTRYSA